LDAKTKKMTTDPIVLQNFKSHNWMLKPSF